MRARWLLIASVGLVILALSGAPALSEQHPIQPGASMTVDGGDYCTLNWVFDGAGGAASNHTYVGTAAHCVEEVGQEVRLASSSLGTALDRIGEVAFRGDASEHGRDYAFIRIDAVDTDRIDPALKGHPDIPSGVSRNYQVGDLMQFSGHGVGFHLISLTREQRQGVLNWTDRVEHQIVGGISPGDSGGPVANLSDGGTAFGIVSTLGVGINTGALTIATVGEGGANLDFVLRDAAAHGFPVTLRTAVDEGS